MFDRINYIETKKTQIDKLLAELAILDTHAREAGENKRIELEVQMKDFSDNLKHMKKVIEDIENAGDDTWPNIKEEADRVWDLLLNSYNTTKATFEKKLNEKKLPSEKKKLKHQLVQLLDEQTPSLNLISAYAGDRELSSEEKTRLNKLKSKRGKDFFSDILLVLTHQHYPSDDAKKLWEAIIKHKYEISKILGRNVGIAASALDYLSNISDKLEAPTLISEPKMATIAEVAIKDELTHLYDSSTFHTKLETEIIRFKRYGTEVSLIMLDIDDFKIINDTYGHQEGDRILGSIASIMLEVTRGLDICARYGGEEFAIILPQTDSARAGILAERLRKRIDDNLKKQNVTVSLGVSTCPRNAKTSKTLIKKADDALYTSKSKGKNCFTVSL